MSGPEPLIIWEPQPGPQTFMLKCPVKEIFFGGARGGGKTEASLGDWLQHSAMYGDQAIGIFVRKRLTQLMEVIARAKYLFKKIGATYNEQSKTFTMPGGARLRFVYLERDVDAEEYQGHSYTRVYIEEVTNFATPTPIDLLRATLRSGTGVPVGMRLTGNPGGPGHTWVKKRYITPAPQGYHIIKQVLDVELYGETHHLEWESVFIPSKVQDNRKMLENDPTYLLRLTQSGSAALVRAWLEGDWDIVDGVFFDKFNPNVNILAHAWVDKIPPTAQRFRAFDWGYATPFSVGWYVISDGTWGLPRNAIYKYREWYGAATEKINTGLRMNNDLVARGVVERERGEFMHYAVADPSIFEQRGGPSHAEVMNAHGCVWSPATRDGRLMGWQQMNLMLAGVGDGPLLYIDESCHYTIEQFTSCVHDPNDVEDLDTKQEDHAMDETRYACMSRPRLAILNNPKPKIPEYNCRMTFDQMFQYSQSRLRKSRERL